MFIWQYLDIPQLEIETLQQQFFDKLPMNELFFQDIAIGVKKICGLTIARSVLIQVPPWAGIANDGIHTDITSVNQQLAINIPLENCEQSTTKFWKSNKLPSILYTPNGHPYTHLAAKDCEQISQATLTKPFIFDTSILHSVTNPQNVWRRAISIRFRKDPWHLVNK
jgi:hypothetical protein